MAILDYSTIESELAKIVGKEHVSSDMVDLVAHERDDQFATVPPHLPDFVVRPATKVEIQAILRLANEHKIPVVPYGAGINRKGLCIASEGGIILDLRRMTKIEIDEEMMVAKVGPGVNFAQMVIALNKYPHLRCLAPDAPATASVLANYMLRGIYPTSTRYGIDHLITMEIVLPNGTILDTGSAATPNSPAPYCGIVNGPDLTKLFQANVGTMGVVTEGRIRLYPMPEKIEPLMIRFPNFESMMEPAKQYTLQNLVAGVWVMTFDPKAMELFMNTKGVTEEIFASLLFLEGTNQEVENQKAQVLQIAADTKGEDMVLPEFMKKEFILDHRYMRTFIRGWRMGNLWGTSCYGPLKNVPKYYEVSKKLCRKNKFETLHFEAMPVSPFQGQTTYIDPCVMWDGGNPDEVERIRQLTQDIRAAFLDIGIYGFFRAFPGTVNSNELGMYGEIWRKIKQLIDPNNIMNPGKPPLA
ncbi:MAG TPA: FAD-binding oxidoreductase [Candidatus Deferrimicrobium sp.]|nr:FAD-binding oxidoreductase [Candidatus Deferrimicrobium sp.]